MPSYAMAEHYIANDGKGNVLDSEVLQRHGHAVNPKASLWQGAARRYAVRQSNGIAWRGTAKVWLGGA